MKEVRFKMNEVLYKEFKMICVQKDLSLPKQMCELARNFIEIMKQNDARINQIKR